MKTAPKHDRFIEALGDDILRRVLDFIYVHPIVRWSTCKALRAGETRQGRLRRFDEAIVRFVNGDLKFPLSRGLLWLPGRWHQREL